MRAGLVVHARYELERLVGSGSFAEVWAARDLVAKTRVALKLLRPPAAPGIRARLAREFRIHQRVSHARICKALDVLPDGEGIVFELLSGPTVASVLDRETTLPVAEALQVAAEALAGLDAAHSAGIVHRDISPTNLVHDGSAGIKVIDFGVAKVEDDELLASSATTADSALGNFAHQAPEQLDDPRNVDGRADLYGVGSVLFLALTGRTVFRGATAAVLVSLKSHCEAPTLQDATGDEWPRALEALVARLLAREPERRFASGAAAAEAVRGTGLFQER